MRGPFKVGDQVQFIRRGAHGRFERVRGVVLHVKGNVLRIDRLAPPSERNEREDTEVTQAA